MGEANDLPALAQWEAPVFTVMHHVPTFCGVPMEFFVGDVLVTLLLMMVVYVGGSILWVSVLLGGTVVYAVAVLGTQIEPRWLPMLCEYVSYGKAYEA